MEIEDAEGYEREGEEDCEGDGGGGGHGVL